MSFQGDKHRTDEIVLPFDGRNFKAGQTDHFTFSLPILGHINAATVQLSRGGKLWRMSEVRSVSICVTRFTRVLIIHLALL